MKYSLFSMALLSIGLCLCLASSLARAGTRYVTPGQSIQTAIDDAADGDEIEVAPGTYLEAINFGGKAVRLYSSGGAAVTFLDGTGHYHVVRCAGGEGPDTVLEGFTVTGGNANGPAQPNIYGGGMYISQASPTIIDCVFTGNSAEDMGGGMYVYESSPTITGCEFINNTSQDRGGAIFVRNLPSHPTLNGCTFTGNSAVNFGGAYYMADCLADFTDCDFSGNTCGTYGGAVYIWRSPPTFTRCSFTANRGGKAGAIFNNNTAHSVLTDCTFTLNESDNHGGALFIDKDSRPRLTGCLFESNAAAVGGGALCNKSGSDAEVINCRFIRNTAGYGGAVENNMSAPTFTGCLFDRNSAPDQAGAVYNYNESFPAFTNCIFRQNSTPRYGGAAANQANGRSTFTNCAFFGNEARGGAGMYNYVNCGADVINCTFTANTATANGGAITNENGSDSIVTNSILWGNAPDEIHNLDTSVAHVAYSDVRGGWAGLGNIDADPLFAAPDPLDPDSIDLRLRAGSPCIDAGDTTALPEAVEVDLNGNPRRLDDPETPDTGVSIAGATVDMGAWEFSGWVWEGDINGDGRVDALDLAILSNNWMKGT